MAGVAPPKNQPTVFSRELRVPSRATTVTPRPAAAPTVSVEMVRSLLPRLSASDAQTFLNENPSFARTLKNFAPPSTAAAIEKQAARAMRHALINTGSLPPEIAIGKDVRAVTGEYARDIGFKNVEVARGKVSLVAQSGAKSVLVDLPQGNAAKQIEVIGKALNVKRFGAKSVEPLPPAMIAGAKVYNETNAHRMAHLSVLAYKDEATVKAQLAAWGHDLKTFTWLENAETDTQGFTVADREGNVFCVFRGTESLTDAKVDADIKFIEPRWKNNESRVHRGFDDALQSVWPQVEKGLAKARGATAESPVFFGGHSLGAALAQLAAMRADTQGLATGSRSQVYTLGSPRVSNDVFREAYNKALPRSFRVANFSDGGWASVQDMVTQVAPLSLGYRALGQLIRLKEDGRSEIISVNDSRAMALPPRGQIGSENDPGTASVEALRGEALTNFIMQASGAAPPEPEPTPTAAPGARGLVAKNFALPSVTFHKSGNYLERTGLAVSRSR